MTALPVLGLLLGVAIAAWLLKESNGEGEDSDVGFIDSIGDWLTTLTTTEQSRVAQLQPDVQAQLKELIYALHHDENIAVSVGQTLRTSAQEKALIAEGKTAASLNISWHQLGRAVDLYVIDPDTGQRDDTGKRLDLYRRMHEIAANLGWRGIAFNADGTKRYITNSKGKKVWDGGHLEWRSPYGSIAEAVQAEGAQFGLA